MKRRDCDYLPYNKARKWVIKNLVPIYINNRKKWIKNIGWNKNPRIFPVNIFWIENTHEFPLDIPRRPQEVYKNSGWNGWKEWFGKK